MIQMSQILTANVAALVLLMIVKLHTLNQNEARRLFDVQLLTKMMNFTIFECVFDTLVFWVDGQVFMGARVINYAGNIIYYILKMCIAYFWPLFIEYKINNSFKKVKKLAIILAIPLLVCSLLVLTTPFSGIIFSVSEDNVYARGGVCQVIPNLLILAYVILGMIKIHFNRHKEAGYLLFPAMVFIVPVTLGIVVQLFNYGISLTFLGISIGLTGVYLSTQNESAYIDQLCGVYNRRYYNDYISSFNNSSRNDVYITGVLIDMDDFKQINDKYGHHTGDKALQLFSSVLRKHVNNLGFAVRYGGDEFILIINKPNVSVEAVIDNIFNEINSINATGKNKFKLAFSYGIASINSDGKMDEFLKTMDSKMYEMKRNRKK